MQRFQHFAHCPRVCFQVSAPVCSLLFSTHTPIFLMQTVREEMHVYSCPPVKSHYLSKLRLSCKYTLVDLQEVTCSCLLQTVKFTPIRSRPFSLPWCTCLRLRAELDCSSTDTALNHRQKTAHKTNFKNVGPNGLAKPLAFMSLHRR